MNLFDMLRRGDKNLGVSPGVAQSKREFSGRTFRALRMPKGSWIRIATPRRFLPFSRLAQSAGWLGVSESGTGRLRVSYERPDTRPAVVDVRLGEVPGEVFLPLPRHSEREPDEAALCLHADRTECYLLVNEVMDRSALIARCVGKGVELGPGHQPQIRPSAEVDVRYVEQKGVQDWITTYGGGEMRIDPALWDRYIIGSAREIPAEERSLDFVFSSHVLEHLINPLQCLENWSGKLKEGGLVACVIPDAMGCKDYVFRLSNPAAWEAEYDRAVRTVGREHYVKYASGRGMMSRVDSLIESEFSIHVHFYSRENVTFLAESGVERGWFSSYELDFRPNNKDFYLVLRK